MTNDTAHRKLALQVLLHFVCFAHVDGALYELDGRKFAPIKHGPSSADTLLQDACKVVKRYMETTNSIQFNLIALCRL
jgi:ubiquitin carboxyl-terminal hydrolase L3